MVCATVSSCSAKGPLTSVSRAGKISRVRTPFGAVALDEGTFGKGTAATLVSSAVRRTAGVDLGGFDAATVGSGGAAARGCAVAMVVCSGSCGTGGGAAGRSALTIGGGIGGAFASGVATARGFSFTAGGGGAGGSLAAGTDLVAGPTSTAGLSLAGRVASGLAGVGLESAAVCASAPPFGPISAASDTAGIRVPARGLRTLDAELAVSRFGFRGVAADDTLGRALGAGSGSIDRLNELMSTNGGRLPSNNPRSPGPPRGTRKTLPVGASAVSRWTSTAGNPLPPITTVSWARISVLPLQIASARKPLIAPLFNPTLRPRRV